MRLDRIILGSNPFVGVSYISQEKRHEYFEKFSKPNNIVEVIDIALELGVKSITCSSSKNMLIALKDIHYKIPNLQVLPIVPNAYEYVRKSTEGFLGLLENLSIYQKLNVTIKAIPKIRGILSRDAIVLLKQLVNIELAPFEGYNIPAIILHGQLTDLGLSINNPELFRIFSNIIRDDFQTEPVLATHNLGRLFPKLDEWGLDIQAVMAPFNKIGFLMNPSFETCIKHLRETKRYIIAKKVLAGGRLDPREALEFVANEKSIGSVAIGIGSPTEAYHTLSIAKSLL